MWIDVREDGKGGKDKRVDKDAKQAQQQAKKEAKKKPTGSDGRSTSQDELASIDTLMTLDAFDPFDELLDPSIGQQTQ